MIIKNLKLIFIHIPKNAGSSVLEFFDWDKIRGEKYGKKYGKKHGGVKHYAKKLGKKYYEYCSFTIIRNPWDRMVSLYFYYRERKVREAQQYEFKEWILLPELITGDIWHTQISYLTDLNEEIDVDFILRFENIEEDWKQLLQDICLPYGKLPHINTSEHEDYRSYYDNKTIGFVQDSCREDIEQFGYTFEK